MILGMSGRDATEEKEMLLYFNGTLAACHYARTECLILLRSLLLPVEHLRNDSLKEGLLLFHCRD